jgi:aquaporin Z
MKNYVTELIGTFFLVLVIGLVTSNGTPMPPLAIGFTLMAMVYMGGHVSGAHYNPAVTLGLLLRRKIATGEAVAYCGSQLAGAVLAAVVSAWLVGNTFAPAPGTGVGSAQALLVEILFTFALVLVVLNVAATKATAGNSYFGLAIGFTVGVGASAGGAISGGAFNPAVGIGPILVHTAAGSGSLANVWLYVVGPALGGVLAAIVHGLQTD